MLDVCLLGTAGMMPLPHRWLTASLMRYNGSSLLIDCGEGTQIAIKEKGWTFKPIDVICFTHYHADHISGLPGLLLSMGNAERTEPLTMIGPKGLERVVGALRMIAPELPFEIRYIEIMEPEADIEINGYHIHAFRVNHNITCYGYTVEIRRAGRFSVEHAKEREIPQKYWNRLQKGGRDRNGRWGTLYPGYGAWCCPERDQSNLLYRYQADGITCCFCKKFGSSDLRGYVCGKRKNCKSKTVQAYDFL